MPPCFQHEHHFCQQMFLSFSSCLPSTYKNKTPYPRLNKAWQNKSNFCIVYLYVDLWACPLLTYVDLCWTMLTYGPVLEGEVRRKESKHIFSDDGTLLDLILLHIYIIFSGEQWEPCLVHQSYSSSSWSQRQWYISLQYFGTLVLKLWIEMGTLKY